jgi:hypothetical protein
MSTGTLSYGDLNSQLTLGNNHLITLNHIKIVVVSICNLKKKTQHYFPLKINNLNLIDDFFFFFLSNLIDEFNFLLQLLQEINFKGSKS